MRALLLLSNDLNLWAKRVYRTSDIAGTIPSLVTHLNVKICEKNLVAEKVLYPSVVLTLTTDSSLLMPLQNLCLQCTSCSLICLGCLVLCVFLVVCSLVFHKTVFQKPRQILSHELYLPNLLRLRPPLKPQSN